MPARPKNPPTIRSAFRHPWPELSYLCRKIHYWIYYRKRRTYALRYLERLKRTLDEVRKSRLAILRQEGLALLFELMGDARRSLRHRRREIQLMQRLHRDIETHDYSKKTIAYILQDRDKAAFAERLAIAKELENRISRKSKPTSSRLEKAIARHESPTGWP